MIKNIGLLVIFISSVMMGFFLSGKLNEKIKFLVSLKTLFYDFEREIKYNVPPLSELFSNNETDYAAQLTECISEGLKNGLNLEESVSAAFETLDCVKLLNKNEAKEFLKIFSSMGGGDCESQLLLLKNAVEKTEMYLENAIDEKNKKSKVCLTVSVYVGLAVIIILI